MKKNFIIVMLLFAGCSTRQYENPHVLIDTQFGEIEVEVYPAKAPLTVSAFLQHVDQDYYKDCSFYRVLKDDDVPANVNTGLIQGGIYKSEIKVKLKGTPHETTRRSGLTHTDGTISMARTEAGSATTEFFICIGDQSPLDSGRRGTADGLGMAAFGKVFKGMDVVRRIQDQDNNGDAFSNNITIKNIKRL